MFKSLEDYPLFVSCHTHQEHYRQHALGLIASLKKLGLDHVVEEVPCTGNWRRNTHAKGPFMLRMLQEHGRPIVWTDVDSRVLAPPVLFSHLECDLAIHWRPSGELSSGTFYLACNSRTVQFLEEWIEACRNSLDHDQVVQSVILRRYREEWPGFVQEELPVEYAMIFDTDAKRCRKPVIQHLQASRAVRKGEVDSLAL
jgi:hypothetical protein